MTIEFYMNSSDNVRVDKSLRNILNVSGTLKEECSITDPIVIIEAENLNGINYMYIPEFSRYYYIMGITSIRNNLWAVTGHVDVLMTYRRDIRNCDGIIARQESPKFANLYLDDDKLLVTSRRKFELITFPKRLETGESSFVLTVAGAPDVT